MQAKRTVLTSAGFGAPPDTRQLHATARASALLRRRAAVAERVESRRLCECAARLTFASRAVGTFMAIYSSSLYVIESGRNEKSLVRGIALRCVRKLARTDVVRRSLPRR